MQSIRRKYLRMRNKTKRSNRKGVSTKKRGGIGVEKTFRFPSKSISHLFSNPAFKQICEIRQSSVAKSNERVYLFFNQLSRCFFIITKTENLNERRQDIEDIQCWCVRAE